MTNVLVQWTMNKQTNLEKFNRINVVEYQLNNIFQVSEQENYACYMIENIDLTTELFIFISLRRLIDKMNEGSRWRNMIIAIA